MTDDGSSGSVGGPDAVAPVGAHRVPAAAPVPASEAPEHDWAAAAPHLFPVFRPVGTHGTSLASLEAAGEPGMIDGTRDHTEPLLDDGPAGIPIGYVLRADAFDVQASVDHLLAWGVRPGDVREAARENLERWSAEAPWSDEMSGHRRLVSSDTGDGGDAVRILVPACREHLREELGSVGRILVGLPDRDLLVAGALIEGDDEFAALLAAFVRDQSAGADEPVDPRVFELVGDELRVFEG